MNINVNCHSSIKIGNIYVDPFKIKEESSDAKYIFITHSHFDHYSLEDVKKIVNNNTVFVCTKDVEEDLVKNYKNRVVCVEPNKDYALEDISFTTFNSYNINKNFHPLSNNWVGYIISVKGVKYAILGDSDVTSEVKEIKCDVLFVPIGGTYTMTAIEASELTNLIKPNLVIPVHYNDIVGTKEDEEAFLENLDKEIDYKLYL